MDLQAMEASLRRKIANPPTDQVSATELYGYINSAYQDLATRYKHFGDRRATDVTVSNGVNTATLGLNAGAILAVKLGVTGKFLKRGSLRSQDRYATAPKGQPVEWMRWGAGITVWPIPEKTYTLTVYHKQPPTALVLATDVPQLPDDWHQGIVFRARWYYWDDKADAAKAAYAHGAFQVWVADKASEFEEEVGMIDASVELPSLARGYGSRWGHSGRYDDGTFDYRE